MRYLTLVALFACLVLSRPSKTPALLHKWMTILQASYQQSCKNIKPAGRRPARALPGTLADTDRDAFLDAADRCWGDISNNDGRLVCKQEWHVTRSAAYSQTCRDIRVRYNVLVRPLPGPRWPNGWIPLSNPLPGGHTGAIENVNGQLRCMDNRGRKKNDQKIDRDWGQRSRSRQKPRWRS